MAFTYTQKQVSATTVLSGDQTHTLLYGGSRSGKSFMIVRALFIRAISVRSRHLMARFRLAHITGSLIAETVPRVLELCFPELRVVHHKSDRFFELPNGSEIWYAGLDDKERTEKIEDLGFHHLVP